jgi:hypothetical protein
MGYAVLCPHANTAFMDFGCDEVFLDGDLEILRRCDLVVVAPGWESSEGTRAEIREAHNELKPVYYWPEDREQIQLARCEPDPFIEYAEEESRPVVTFEPDPRLREALENYSPDD